MKETNNKKEEKIVKNTANDDSLIDETKIKLVPGNDADLTNEDLEALGPEDLSMDLGDDEDLKHRIFPVDFSGKDLDVPAPDLDDYSEMTGMADEENNPGSIGGDAQDDLEEETNS